MLFCLFDSCAYAGMSYCFIDIVSFVSLVCLSIAFYPCFDIPVGLSFYLFVFMSFDFMLVASLYVWLFVYLSLFMIVFLSVCRSVSVYPCFYIFTPSVRLMILKLDGKSEIGAHVLNKIGKLICFD